MNILDNKKIKIVLMICIIAISLLELYWGVQVAREYRGCYCVAIFIPFIIQPYWYYKILFRKQQNYLKIRIIPIVLISLFLPLIIHYTIPNYTYNNGKFLIEQHTNLDSDVVFIDYSFSESTIPVLNCKKTLLGTNREYYYGIQLDKINKYFTVNAVSGKMTHLSEGYWEEQETDSIENNLKQITTGIDKFARLENGKLKISGMIESANNAVESMDMGSSKSTSLTTFILNSKGYHYIEERSEFNEETQQYQYSATKQVQGKLFMTFPFEKSTKDLKKAYEWADVSGSHHNHYEPNGALNMMLVPAKYLGNEEYIETITKEKVGSLTKYTLRTNDAFVKFAKEEAHRPEENFILIDNRDVYWIDNDGLLVKHQNYNEFEWTIDGIPDTYISDITAELTGYNNKNLTGLGDELSPISNVPIDEDMDYSMNSNSEDISESNSQSPLSEEERLILQKIDIVA